MPYNDDAAALSESTIPSVQFSFCVFLQALVMLRPESSAKLYTLPRRLLEMERSLSKTGCSLISLEGFRSEPHGLIAYTGLRHYQLSNMASLSRRACYKCGNVGHYAGRPI